MVYPLTLTGMGDRVHLASPQVGLETAIQDVINAIVYEALDDVVLVGHSFAGKVIAPSLTGCLSASKPCFSWTRIDPQRCGRHRGTSDQRAGRCSKTVGGFPLPKTFLEISEKTSGAQTRNGCRPKSRLGS